MEKTKENKQDLILKSAKELFWKHGFKRVTVEEICLKAGVSKMTFYRLYSDKIELAKSVYDKVATEGFIEFHKIMLSDLPPEEKIKKMLLLKLEGTNDISQEFLTDFYSDKELGLKEFVESKIGEAWELILNDFKTAQKDGWLRNDFKPEFIIAVSQRVTDLINDPVMLKIYDKPQDFIMEFVNLLMFGIASRK